mgnify:CR=1 FL=1
MLIGVESGSNEMMKRIRKDITLEQAQSAVAAAIKKSDAIGTKMNVAVVDAGADRIRPAQIVAVDTCAQGQVLALGEAENITQIRRHVGLLHGLEELRAERPVDAA